MPRIYSNGPSKDFVGNPFNRLLMAGRTAYLAAPYFTLATPIVEAAKRGVNVQVIVGLNTITTPDALAQIVGVPNLAVRYFTSRFHAKLYIFGGDDVLLGSSNLTDAGMYVNREAMISLESATDTIAVDEARALFADLWDAAQVLSSEKLSDFRLAWKGIERKGLDPDTLIERAVGKSEPTNINVASRKRTSEQVFLRDLRMQVYEQYRPAFLDVSSILDRNSFHRIDFASLEPAIETNRFLNWVRQTHAPGDESWQNAPLRSPDEREAEVVRYGSLWSETSNDRVPGHYFERLAALQGVFGTPEAMASATKDDFTEGLLGIHAFLEQSRFVKGGEPKLPDAFWSANTQDLAKVRRSLSHLVHGSGEFIERMHDLLYDRNRKLGYFGYFCTLELFGSVKPAVCPPLNGRMAKALRFLGYDVRPR